MAGTVLLTRDKDEVLSQITDLLNSIEPMASYIPAPVLSLLVESAADRKIPAIFRAPPSCSSISSACLSQQTAPSLVKR